MICQSEQAEQEQEEEDGVYFSYFHCHWQGKKGLEALAVERLVIISGSHLESKGGDRQWPLQEDDSLGSTDVGWLEKQRVPGAAAEPLSLLWKH